METYARRPHGNTRVRQLKVSVTQGFANPVATRLPAWVPPVGPGRVRRGRRRVRHGGRRRVGIALAGQKVFP